MPLAPLGLPAGKGVPARVELQVRRLARRIGAEKKACMVATQGNSDARLVTAFQTRAGPRAGSRPPSCSPRASPSALRRPAGRQERGAAVRALSLADLDWSAFPAELSLLGAFASGAALSAVLLAGAREGLPLLGRPSPLRPLPNAARLQQGPDNTTPDRVLTGTGVYVLQHLLNYFYPGLASVLAQVIRKRIQPGLERLQSATLRDIRVEDLTMGASHRRPTPHTRCMFASTHRLAHARRRRAACGDRHQVVRHATPADRG